MNKKIIITIMSVFAAAYIVGVIYFSGHFYPKTVINSEKYAFMNVDSAKESFLDKANNYSLLIKAREGKNETISSSDINLSFSVLNEFEDIKKEQNPFLWFASFFAKNQYDIDFNVNYDEELLKSKFDSLDILKDMREPENADIEYNESSQSFEITPEDNGTKINTESCYNAVKEAVTAVNDEIDIEDTYENAQITSDNEKLIENKDKMNEYIKPVITYNFGDKTETVDKDIIKDWLAVSDENEVIFDRQKVKEFVDYIGKTYNTFGKTRQFKTSYGNTVSVAGGDYGWWLNREAEIDSLVSVVKEGKSITKEPVYYQKAAQYGSSDIGDSYAEVNLTTQHFFLYIDGKRVMESDIVSGNPNRGRATPTGTYGITYKELDATLVGENYETPVKYWMPFNMDVGFHDASWQSSFGGKRYLTNGSHGCINLPVSVAEKLYSYVWKNMPVVVYTMDTEDIG